MVTSEFEYYLLAELIGMSDRELNYISGTDVRHHNQILEGYEEKYEHRGISGIGIENHPRVGIRIL